MLKSLFVIIILMSTFEKTDLFPNDFLVKIEEVEKTDNIPDDGVFGGGKNLLLGKSDLKSLLKYIYSNTGKYLKHENIHLTHNPFLNVAVASKRRSTLEERSIGLLKHLKENFNLDIDSVAYKTNFILVSSIDKLEHSNKKLSWGEGGFNGKGKELIFKDFTLDGIVKILKSYNHLKIEVDFSKIPKDESSRVNIILPKTSLASEELLSKKLSELEVEYEMVEKEYWEYKIKN